MNQARWPGVRRSALEVVPATTVIAGGTALVSALITLLGREGEAAVIAGFVPATVLHTLSAPDGLFLLPVWLTPLTATLLPFQPDAECHRVDRPLLPDQSGQVFEIIGAVAWQRVGIASREQLPG